MTYLTWADFDQAVAELARIARTVQGLRSVYGPPRGGLVLAVALSHALGLPLVTKPTRATLWVDDVVEAGRTLKETRGPAVVALCWIAKPARPEVTHVTEAPLDSWIVFPWENLTAAQADHDAYTASRSANP